MRTTDAIVLSEYGGPDKLKHQAVELPPLGKDELLVRHTAIAVNFHDCYVRSGLYKTLDLPGVPGLEAVGVVEEIGANVSGFAVGDRIGWVSPSYGGYAKHRVLSADLAIKLPAFLSDNQAAASLVKGLTVTFLVTKSFRVQPDQTVLIHAAAGGVGQMLTQACSRLGARVIATVGSKEKEAVARSAGANEIIFYKEDDFLKQVLAITQGKGVDAVFDSVGADTFTKSLQCLDYGGALVSYGQSSGAVAPFTPSDLAVKSLSVSRPIIFHFIRKRVDLLRMATETFNSFESGLFKPSEPVTFPLAKAGDAHRLLEARLSPGGVVLIP
jgi:NADPH:quinone reductase